MENEIDEKYVVSIQLNIYYFGTSEVSILQ